MLIMAATESARHATMIVNAVSGWMLAKLTDNAKVHVIPSLNPKTTSRRPRENNELQIEGDAPFCFLTLESEDGVEGVTIEGATETEGVLEFDVETERQNDRAATGEKVFDGMR